MTALPTVKIGRKEYFFDARLQQLRNTTNPHDVIELTDVNAAMLQLKVSPMPGDLVCVTKTDDTLIKTGSCGIIEGVAGEQLKEYHVLFNPSPLPWWDGNVITSSGGPERIIKTARLTPTGESRKQAFQYFPRGIMGAGLAKVKTKEVNVFKVDLTV